MMDLIFRFYKLFARCYIDDIIIFFKIFENYVQHFNTVFELFDRLKITIKKIKTFLNYPFIILLKQRINEFDIITLKKRIAAIRNLAFSEILKDLETYLEFTEWLR